MAKTTTFRSPGVFETEIDKTQFGETLFGTGGCTIGAAQKGPAFVPVQLASWKDYVDNFGEVDTDKEYWSAYALREYLKHNPSAVMIRVLGAGYAARASDGTVPGAGMLLPRSTTAGYVGAGGMAFLGAIHSSSTGYLTECGLMSCSNVYTTRVNGEPDYSFAKQLLPYGGGALIKAALIMAPGVFPLVQGRTDAGTIITGITGSYHNNEFCLYFYGHTDSTDYPIRVTASFDIAKDNYFGNVFNRDLTLINEYGYALYADFGNANVGSDLDLDVNADHCFNSDATAIQKERIAFCLSGSDTRFNNFQDRYTTPISPYVVSQPMGVGSPPESMMKKLFRIEALSDGAWANDKIKISIENIRKGTTDTEYGTFTLVVRDFYDNDENQTVYERFSGLTLDPDDKNYICRRIGDRTLYYDHDQSSGDKRIVVEGNYPNVSKYIRVVPESDMDDGLIPLEALPWGFSGYYLLNTSGSLSVEMITDVTTNWVGIDSKGTKNTFGSAVIPPIPMRKELSKYAGDKKLANKKLYWGVKFERTLDPDEPNSSKLFEGIDAYTKFFGNPRLSSPPVFLQDNNPRYWENDFSLARVAVLTKSNGDPDLTKLTDWKYTRYRMSSSLQYYIACASRSFMPSTDLNMASDVAKFSFFVQYGWDGVDFRDLNQTKFNNIAAYEDANKSGGGVDSNMVNSYMQAIDIAAEPDFLDISLLIVPGIREPLVTDYAIEKMEDRFDAFYIMDIEQYDTDLDYVLTGSSQKISVTNTLNKFDARSIDSNFAAAYFPDVVLYDDINEVNVASTPPSTVVFGAYAFSDKVSHPWYAPAGYTRGAMKNVVDTDVRLNQTNRDELYETRINPIVSFANEGPVIFGQKTLAAIQSALDRVNVRRMLIDVRRSVRSVARRLIFEPNIAATWNQFVRQVTPLLDRVKEQNGIERFKIVMDETTTSRTDIENNILRGKIFLQPTYAAEFIDLSFIITNSDAQFI